MSGMTDVLMIGIVLIGGYYMLTYMSQQQTTGTTGDTTNIGIPLEQTDYPDDPTRLQECANFRTSDEDPNRPCENECGKSGHPDKCHRCEAACDQAGVYGPPYPWTTGLPKRTTNTIKNAAGICESEGGTWKTIGSRGCCQCPNRFCRNKCKSSGGSGSKKKPSGKRPTPSSPASKPRSVPPGSGKVSGQRKAPPAKRSFAAYLGSAFNRWGPSYNYRDNFADPLISKRVVPSPVDFRYESVSRPYYLGPRSPERASLIRRFQSNFSTLRFSG